jgi:hypothetical protein
MRLNKALQLTANAPVQVLGSILASNYGASANLGGVGPS